MNSELVSSHPYCKTSLLPQKAISLQWHKHLPNEPNGMTYHGKKLLGESPVVNRPHKLLKSYVYSTAYTNAKCQANG